MIKGSLSGPGKKGKLHLIQAATISSQILQKYAGEYLTGNQKILISYSPLNVLDVVIVQNDNSGAINRTVTIIPLDEKTFFTSKSAIAPPEDKDEIVSFTIDQNGKVTGLELIQPDGTKTEASRINSLYSEEQVTIKNNNIVLGGTLFLPNKSTPFKALVLLQGAGPMLRTNPVQNLRARFFAEMGIATLIMDKRATGNASGSDHQPTFSEMADDALAGINYLKNRSEILPNKIGIMGISESAWVVPIAIAKSKNVAFAIISSGGAITDEQTSMYEIERALQSAKFSTEDITDALAFTKIKWNYALTGQNWEEYKKKLDEVKDKKWFDLAEGPLDKDPKNWDAMRLKSYEDRDAEKYIRQMNVPLLLMFGDPKLDDKVPVEMVKNSWLNILKNMNYKDYTIKDIAGTGHTIFYKVENAKAVKNNEAFNITMQWLNAH